MRVCPTVEGSSTPLILHRISATDCLARQQCNYHKCHRCIYRGKAAAWEPANPAADGGDTIQPVAARGVPTTKSPKSEPAKTVELPARRPAGKPKTSPAVRTAP